MKYLSNSPVSDTHQLTNIAKKSEIEQPHESGLPYVYYDDFEEHIECTGWPKEWTAREKCELLRLVKLKDILTFQEALIYTGFTYEFLKHAIRCESVRYRLVVVEDFDCNRVTTRFKKSDLDAFMLENPSR